jgi:hypothetical protein
MLRAGVCVACCMSLQAVSTSPGLPGWGRPDLKIFADNSGHTIFTMLKHNPHLAMHKKPLLSGLHLSAILCRKFQ